MIHCGLGVHFFVMPGSCNDNIVLGCSPLLANIANEFYPPPLEHFIGRRNVTCHTGWVTAFMRGGHVSCIRFENL